MPFYDGLVLKLLGSLVNKSKNVLDETKSHAVWGHPRRMGHGGEF